MINQEEYEGSIGNAFYKINEAFSRAGGAIGEKLEGEEVKNKEWLKRKIKGTKPDAVPGYEFEVISKKEVYKYIDQLDEPEVLSQELPVIPKYVADWIEDLKSKKINLLESIYTHGEDINDYMREKGNVLMRAWLDGYKIEVEKEPLYYVVKDGVVILSKRYRDYDSHESHWIGTVTNKEYIKENPDKVRFTEQEIKDFDERFWSFAVPVEEVQND